MLTWLRENLFAADAIIMGHVASSQVRFSGRTGPGPELSWEGFRKLVASYMLINTVERIQVLVLWSKQSTDRHLKLDAANSGEFTCLAVSRTHCPGLLDERDRHPIPFGRAYLIRHRPCGRNHRATCRAVAFDNS